MPLPRRAEHEIVARRAPGGLLQHLDVGHAVLGEEALFLGDDQRRGIGQRDEAEHRPWWSPARCLAAKAPRGKAARTAPTSAAAAVVFRHGAAGDAWCWRCLRHVQFPCLSGDRHSAGRRHKKTPPEPAAASRRSAERHQAERRRCPWSAPFRVHAAPVAIDRGNSYIAKAVPAPDNGALVPDLDCGFELQGKCRD